ncbi:MAG: hypothetical protein KA712_08405 [Myxococcales bacterium]|nr:hypothetical protein [Myxococcales bacterium]
MSCPLLLFSTQAAGRLTIAYPYAAPFSIATRSSETFRVSWGCGLPQTLPVMYKTFRQTKSSSTETFFERDREGCCSEECVDATVTSREDVRAQEVSLRPAVSPDKMGTLEWVVGPAHQLVPLE